jgi:PBP1b-binding outer membrane lipoprotein LpoB
MKKIARTGMLLAGAVLAGGCAVGQEMGWQHNSTPATEVQLASCDAGTATLKDKPDHDVAHRACVDAKVRQHVD